VARIEEAQRAIRGTNRMREERKSSTKRGFPFAPLVLARKNRRDELHESRKWQLRQPKKTERQTTETGAAANELVTGTSRS
jgi:hypothetical protein